MTTMRKPDIRMTWQELTEIWELLNTVVSKDGIECV